MRALIRASAWLTVLGCSIPEAVSEPPVDSEAAERFLAIVAAEDARPREGPELALLFQAAEGGETSADSLAQQVAVRALGRLENPAFLGRLGELLVHPDPDVRGHAADAVAQAVHRVDGSQAFPLLMSRVQGDDANIESDPRVLGVLARSLGRVRVEASSRGRALQAIMTLTDDRSFYHARIDDQARTSDADSLEDSATSREPASPEQMKGALLGLESLARAGTPFTDEAVKRLQELTLYGRMGEAPEPDAGRVRALAVAILDRLGKLAPTRLEPALRDPSTVVRLAAAEAISRADPDVRSELIRRALMDPVAGVRVAAVRAVAAGALDELACNRLLVAGARDESRVVRIEALRALAEPCPASPGQIEVLLEAASSLGPETRIDWQAPAEALVSLANFAPEHAVRLLPTYLDHENELVRARAAEAAHLLHEADALRRMALSDPGPNARVAALNALASLGPVSEQLLLAQLEHDDPQLLMVAGRLLAAGAGADSDGESPPIGAEGHLIAKSLLDALDRISAAERETWRDPRVALLRAAAELGGSELTHRLEPYASDYDSSVARLAVELLGGWSGSEDYVSAPAPLPRLELPSAAELRELERLFVRLHMQRGGVIAIKLLPHLAPTNAHRFRRLVRDGYFDGLTFHRSEPNFVIQGGSPGANEFAGDGPYTRDEVGMLPHWRGTVGLSTRGRDTGDAQIFVNLFDNVRLNHDYTIFGIVIDGIEVVDEVVAGDVIERAELHAPGSG